jgi:hypothetical protein
MAREKGGVMHDGDPRRGFVLPVKKNISGTRRRTKIEDSAETVMGCVFIEAFTWPAGFPPFCDRPVLPGSAYCPAHAAQCSAGKPVRSGGR